jgi:thiol-disulfide isomerase/thioredoxin
MIYDRVFILLAVIAAAALLGFAWQQYQANRLRKLGTAGAPGELRQLVGLGRPALLYFSTSDCAQCRFQQAPILKQFSAQTQVAVVPVDAVEQENLARYYGIMTVPSTVLLDDALRPVAVNHGLATLPRLHAQLQGV